MPEETSSNDSLRRPVRSSSRPQLPFWKECLRLLYWVFFKPLTLRRICGE